VFARLERDRRNNVGVTLVVRRTRRAGTAVGTAVGTLAVLAALTLTSCGFGGESDDAAGGQSSGDAGSRAGSEAHDTPAAGGSSSREPQAKPAAGDLANFSCTRARGGVWAASGDVTNSAREPMVYTLTVVTVEGSEISGEETKDLLLKPDEAVTFDLPTVAQGPADACMPRLVRAPR
jgi:hypothetical protein